MRIQEVITKPQAPQTPEQSRIQALKAQAKRSQNAVKIERQRQKMQSAQQAISKHSTATTESLSPEPTSNLIESAQLKTFHAQLRVTDGTQGAIAQSDVPRATIPCKGTARIFRKREGDVGRLAHQQLVRATGKGHCRCSGVDFIGSVV